MDFIANLIYSLMPDAVTHNIWFAFAVVLAYAILSAAQAFVKDPRFGWLAKYDDPIQTVLGVLGIWQKRSYSLMAATKAVAVIVPDKVEPAPMSINDAPKMDGKG